MKIFVTGGTGCLGIHLIRRLLNAGHEVLALARKSSDTSALKGFKGMTFITGDMLDGQFLANLKLIGLEAIIHCAAVTTFSPAKKSPAQIFKENVTGTQNLANFALSFPIKQFIFISSFSAMGDCYNGRRDESAVCLPDSEYGRSKFESEGILSQYRLKFGLPLTIIRPGLIYGAYDRGGMRMMIKAISEGKFAVFGSGNNIKNIVSVHNLVEAIMCSLGSAKAIGEVFLVSDGKDYTLNELCSEIALLLGRRARFAHIPGSLASFLGFACSVLNMLPGIRTPLSAAAVRKMMSSNTFSTSKIQRTLNYVPKVNLRQGLEEEIDWLRSQGSIV